MIFAVAAGSDAAVALGIEAIVGLSTTRVGDGGAVDGAELSELAVTGAEGGGG